MLTRQSSANGNLPRGVLLEELDSVVRQYFERHRRWPSVSETASLLGTDCRGLRQRLKAAGHAPARQLLPRIRVVHAAATIASDVKIEAARCLAGYAVGNKTAFNTQFRRHLGCTPQEFRARCSDASGSSFQGAATPATVLIGRFDANEREPPLPSTAAVCAHVWYLLECHPARRPSTQDVLHSLAVDTADTTRDHWRAARRAPLTEVITYGCVSYAWLLMRHARIGAREAARIAGLCSYKYFNRLSKKYSGLTAARCGESFPFLLDWPDALQSVHQLHANRRPASTFFEWPSCSE